MKTMKILLEIEVPADTRAQDFAVVIEQAREVFWRVGYQCKVRDIVPERLDTPVRGE